MSQNFNSQIVVYKEKSSVTFMDEAQHLMQSYEEISSNASWYVSEKLWPTTKSCIFNTWNYCYDSSSNKSLGEAGATACHIIEWVANNLPKEAYVASAAIYIAPELTMISALFATPYLVNQYISDMVFSGDNTQTYLPMPE